jgi:hypothetical protein
MAELLSEVTDQELDRVEELLRRRRAEERGR